MSEGYKPKHVSFQCIAEMSVGLVHVMSEMLLTEVCYYYYWFKTKGKTKEDLERGCT